MPQCSIKIPFSILSVAPTPTATPPEVPPGPRLPRDIAPEERLPSPAPIPPSIIASIVEGVTNRDEMLSWFGEPDAAGTQRMEARPIYG